MDIEKELQELADFLIKGKHLETERLTKELVSEGVEPRTILDEGLMRGMTVVGERFRERKMFVPQVLISARAMKFSMKILEPLMIGEKNFSKGKIILGTVKGDVHDIGKNIVGIMLQGAGYEVIDLGTGVSAETYFEEYTKSDADIIGLSALLTTTMIYMEKVIGYFRNRNVSIPIIIGGAPCNKKFAEQIGATGYGQNAYEAVKLIDSILQNE